MLDEQRADLLSQRVTAHHVGEGRQRIGAHPGALHERRDDRLPGQGGPAEHPRVQDGRIDRVGANERPPLRGREPGRAGQMVDGLGDPLSVDRQRGLQLRGQPGHEL